MKKILLLLVLLPMMVISQTQTENYIKTTTYKIATATSIAAPTINQASQNIVYFDGLGRPIQQIASKQSESGKNIVTPIEYDGFGRQSKDYLPYATQSTSGLDYETNALIDVMNYPSYIGQDPFSQKLLEASPVSRVMKQAAPGIDWALGVGHEIKLDYQTNTSATEVKLFGVTTTWNATTGLYDIVLINNTGTIFYDVNQLYKTITYDENTAATPAESAGSTVEFKNKEGQIVLKRAYEAGVKHDTYYVYDIYGNLTYVIPPKADVAITTTVLNDLCYQYKYDYRNRLVEKKLPGKQWEFIVYDKLDRPVATGPAFSPFGDSSTGWLITKYDAFSRVVYTGWLSSATVSTTDRKTLQDAQNLAPVLYETKQTSGTIDGIPAYYSNAIAPTTFKLLTVNYYDEYTFPNVSTIPTPVEGQSVLVNVKSMPTGSWVRALTSSSAILGETITTLYDSKARPIRTYSQNYLGGYTYTDNKLDPFSGQLQYTITKHKRTNTNTELTIKEEFAYSPQDRLLTHTHTINYGTPQLLAANTYNELGQLISKKVGNTTTTPLQKVDYTYNIRGWLTGINDIATLNPIVGENDLFTFKINYNAIEGTVAGVKSLYNGNISETYWRTASDNTLRKYGYEYDNLNRLKNATYQKPDNVNSVTNSYNENLTYDKNGNIISLLRNGDLDPVSGTIGIDNLSYGYQASTNKLVTVLDSSNNVSGFNDRNLIGDDYTYDLNGNLITDKNKNITNIVYNHLNLPVKITFGTGTPINYLYNALGQKLQKIIVVSGKNGASTKTSTDYLGGFQYTTIDQSDPLIHYLPIKKMIFPQAEGYVRNDNLNYNIFNYVFNCTDHLGNVRLSYQDINKDGMITNNERLEESNYYPFGLKHKGYNNNNIQLGYKYKYNGKELQDELGLGMYDMEARNYMPDLGRWGNIDELAEEFEDLSPYNFSNNNPISFSDPSGMAPENSQGLTSTVVNNEGEIIDHKDDGDDNIYLNSRKGKVIGKEQEEKKYELGGYLEKDDLFANAKLPSGFKLMFKVEPTEFEISPLIGGIKGGLNYIVYIARGGKAVKYVGITSQFAIRQATHLRKKGIFIEKALEGLSKADAKAVEQVLIELYKLPKNGGNLLNKINSIAKKNPAYGEALKRGAEILKDFKL